jgi:hypothetical protein
MRKLNFTRTRIYERSVVIIENEYGHDDRNLGAYRFALRLKYGTCSSSAAVRSQRANGWVPLDDRFEDDGYSGATSDRPAFQRLFALLRLQAAVVSWPVASTGCHVVSSVL